MIADSDFIYESRIAIQNATSALADMAFESADSAFINEIRIAILLHRLIYGEESAFSYHSAIHGFR